ncbi:unnamed protein product [marine sediment metagenome]|uniref:Siphovirus Gp157 family protein n=1 Tax=marine sediment metagenome TaxID=412755 RepID=X0ZZF5_9ZZZZ
MKMTKLYELTGQYLALAELADDPNMPGDVLADTLEGIEGAIEVKAEALLQVVAGLEGDTGAIDHEIKRLQARKAVINNRAKSLKDYLKTNMEQGNINKISCPLFQITLSKPRPMVAVVDSDAIPDEYIKTTVVKAPMKKEILAALKAGEDVPGCLLGESARGLLVK